MISIEKLDNCTGCTACASICPRQCIQMVKDQEGFLYPRVNMDKCVDCNLCKKICPVQREQSDYTGKTMHRLACQNQNKAVRIKSTSGGVFSAIADEVLKQNGIVIGAGFREDMHVIHKITRNHEDLKELRASKYVQSEMGSVFLSIRKILSEEDSLVFFVGTPCQVSGLHSFLGKDYENLFTADFACYGVPSPGIYDKWVTMIEKKHKSKIKEIYFRDKKYGYSGVNVKLVLQNGKVLEDRNDVKSFTKTFFSKLNIRPSCYNCPFRTKVKKSDFTLSDFWEIGEYDASMDDNIGTTHVMVHTEKGRIFLLALKNLKSYQIEVLSGTKLKQFYHSLALERTIPPNRKMFYEDAQRMEYGQLVKKYLPNKPKDLAAFILKPIIRKMPPMICNAFFRGLKNYRIKKYKRSNNLI